jgi:hypothetical protein
VLTGELKGILLENEIILFGKLQPFFDLYMQWLVRLLLNNIPQKRRERNSKLLVPY